MADFCQQCSIEIFGEDCGDLANISTPEDDLKGVYYLVLCEGCGLTQVDSKGRCMVKDCDMEHKGPDTNALSNV